VLPFFIIPLFGVISRERDVRWKLYSDINGELIVPAIHALAQRGVFDLFGDPMVPLDVDKSNEGYLKASEW